MHEFVRIALVGIGATGLVDAWAAARLRLLGVPPPDYALLGRWIGHMRRGRFRHGAIGAVPVVPGERMLGWTAHYAIGIAFALLLVLVAGTGWLERPEPGAAFAVGICTVAAPFLLMQPAMGAGIAAARTPNPAAARMHSLVTHAVFGLGLFLAAHAVRILLFITGA